MREVPSIEWLLAKTAKPSASFTKKLDQKLQSKFKKTPKTAMFGWWGLFLPLSMALGLVILSAGGLGVSKLWDSYHQRQVLSMAGEVSLEISQSYAQQADHLGELESLLQELEDLEQT